MLVALKRAGCMYDKLNVSQASSSQQLLKLQSNHLLYGHTLPVFFAIDQSHHPPRSTEIQPMSQQADATTLPFHG